MINPHLNFVARWVYSLWSGNCLFIDKPLPKLMATCYESDHTNTFQLTHLPMDIMAAISQTIFSDAFLWMKSFVIWLKFHWSLFVRVQFTINSFGLDNGLAPNRRQAINWTIADPIHWLMDVALGGVSRRLFKYEENRSNAFDLTKI